MKHKIRKNKCIRCEHFTQFDGGASGDGTINEDQGMCLNRKSDTNHIFGYRGSKEITTACKEFKIYDRKGSLLSKTRRK